MRWQVWLEKDGRFRLFYVDERDYGHAIGEAIQRWPGSAVYSARKMTPYEVLFLGIRGKVVEMGDAKAGNLGPIHKRFAAAQQRA